ncbi:MAG: DUF4404 family protein [Elusimicrobia bacterium]|nr:DUF4404 family protein [Elusimicrobiota bacterium]
MLEETIKRIELAVGSLQTPDGEKKQELLKLLRTLKAEVDRLSRTHGEHAHSIAGYAALAAHEATRQEKPEGMLEHTVEGLSLSSKGFEASHPELVEAVNNICTMLARLGI